MHHGLTGTLLMVGAGKLAETTATEFPNQPILGYRRTPPQTSPNSNLRYTTVDLGNSVLPEFPSDISAVIFAAATGGRDEAAYRNLYEAGLPQILEQVPENIPFLLVSSTSVNAGNRGITTETTPAVPTTSTGRILLAAEQLVLARSGYVLRCSGIYGPGRNWLVNQVVNSQIKLTAANAISHRIHQEDVARAAVHLLTSGSEPGIYLATDDAPVHRNTVIEFLCSVYNAPLPGWDEGAPLTQPDRFLLNIKLKNSGFQFRYPSFVEGYLSYTDHHGNP